MLWWMGTQPLPPLDTEVDLGPGHVVLDGDPAPHGKGHSSPHFLAHVCYGQTVAHISNYWALVNTAFWAPVCKKVRPMLSDCCLSVLSCPVCLSVTLVYCRQTVGWIKMKLSVQVGFGPGHIVLDGDAAPLPQREWSPPIFGPCLLWPNGWMDEDATWYGSRPQPRAHCVRRGPSSTPRKGHSSPLFLAHVYCGWKCGNGKWRIRCDKNLWMGYATLKMWDQTE